MAEESQQIYVRNLVIVLTQINIAIGRVRQGKDATSTLSHTYCCAVFMRDV